MLSTDEQLRDLAYQRDLRFAPHVIPNVSRTMCEIAKVRIDIGRRGGWSLRASGLGCNPDSRPPPHDGRLDMPVGVGGSA